MVKFWRFNRHDWRLLIAETLLGMARRVAPQTWNGSLVGQAVNQYVLTAFTSEGQRRRPPPPEWVAVKLPEVTFTVPLCKPYDPPKQVG